MDNKSDSGLPRPVPSACSHLPQPKNPDTLKSSSDALHGTNNNEHNEADAEDAAVAAGVPIASETPVLPAGELEPTIPMEPTEQPTERIKASATSNQPPAEAPDSPAEESPSAGGVPPAEEVTTATGTYQEPPEYDSPIPPSGVVPPATPKKKTPWGWIIGCGCGCLLVLALGVAALFGGFAWLVSQDEADIEGMVGHFEEQLKEVEANLEASNTTNETAVEPSKAAALSFAESRKEGWVALNDSNSADWRTARVVIGPTVDDLRTWLDLEWSDEDSAYRLVDEGPIAQIEDGEFRNVPNIYMPGPDVAIEAALVGREEWVAKIKSKTPDYKTVTVLIGPPESEWAGAIKLEWDNSIDSYRVIEENAVEYP